MNCIEKYVKTGDCDQSLEKAWRDYSKQLAEVEEELKLLSNPDTKPLEEKKLDLLHKIEDHKKEIMVLERRVHDIERQLSSMMTSV